MLIDDYIDVISELKQEVIKLDNQIDCNSRSMREADVYLENFEEPEDVKVFSPRNMETVHREEIQKT